jgi:pimeloyl-ACP methyl ester carboxylesterase
MNATVVPPVIVLVHGSFHGAWIWRDVARMLWSRGFEVLTPSLTGTGERHHLASPEIGLETQIADVVGMVQMFGVERMLMLGHAGAGLVISGAADRLRSHVEIEHLVYYDAKIPSPGDMSFINRRNEMSARFYDGHAAKWKDGWLMNFFDSYPIEMLAPADRPDVQDLLKSRLTTQPAGPWIDELVYTGLGITGLRKTLLVPALQHYIPTLPSFFKAATGPEWSVEEIATYRDGMLTEPQVVADWIAAAAQP